MRKRASIQEKPALDLIDEAVALLRECPLPVVVLYYIGAAPFVLYFLYFWTDMSRGAFARDHLIESSFFLTLGFVWCKFWQSLFATHLLAVASRRPLPPWTWRRLLHLAADQAAIQSTGLFILPVALLITLPVGFAHAFYQNAAILSLDAAGDTRNIKALRREAAAEARRWPAQNHVGLAILAFFALVVFFNIVILILSLPSLLKSLFGIETMFSRSLFSMLNTTLFAAAAGITYLCVDPVFKAFYTIRCFHGRALSTGDDLRIGIRALSPSPHPAIAAAAAITAAILLSCGHAARGADAAPAPGIQAQSTEIDQAITKVLNKPEFAWRAPREAAEAEEKRSSNGFFEKMSAMFKRWLKPLKRLMSRFGHWLYERFTQRDTSEAPTGGGSWRSSLKFFAWIFSFAAACALAVIGWKLWRRRASIPEIIAQPQPILPDLNAEDVAADQLPEDAWMRLARDLVEKGDLRLALRALYLAALAHLGNRQIISIARYKSNSEYRRELIRRRPAQTELIATFSDTVGSFERAWYGMHEVTPDTLSASELNLERIRQC